MSKKNKQRDKGKTFSQRTAPVIGYVWSAPSFDLAETIMHGAEHRIALDGLKPGPQITRHTFYAMDSLQGSFIALVGFGTMFNPNLVASAGRYMAQHDCTLLPPSDLTKTVIDRVKTRWLADRKNNRKQARLQARQASRKVIG